MWYQTGNPVDFVFCPQVGAAVAPRLDRVPEPDGETPSVRPDAISVPHPSRWSPSEVGFGPAMAAHADAVARRAGGYTDPGSGLFVMTARYLLDRGYCCDRGCRHCPYVGATTGSNEEKPSR